MSRLVRPLVSPVHWVADTVGLGRIVRLLSTSIGQKYVMAITGLMLCGFLAVHLAGNLLLYVGSDAYNHYAESLHSQEWLIRFAEVGLVVLFLTHIVLALSTSSMNRRARRVSYFVKESKQPNLALRSGGAGNWMFVTGAIVLGFMLLHVSEFTLNIEWSWHLAADRALAPYDKAMLIMQNPVSFFVYIVGSGAVGIHLGHGVASSFQSLGLNHPKYNKLVERAGLAFAVVIGTGFASFPVMAMMFS